MTNQHPVTPPPELVREWYLDATGPHYESEIATRAAQWGADQELEACCELLWQWGYNEISPRLNRIRRPEPPSLKEQSLALIDLIQGNEKAWDIRDLDVVRRALEQIDD